MRDNIKADIKVVVLKNDTSIIADIKRQNGILRVSLPHRILYTQTGMAIVRYLPEIKDVNMFISLDDVLLLGDAEPEVIEAYMNAVSPLKTPMDTLH